MGRAWRCLLVASSGKSTVTAFSYRHQLIKLKAKLDRKRPRRGQLYFHHDNASHVATPVKETIKQSSWNLLPHPPYSPDLAPSDYHLFRSLNNDLRGKKFNTGHDLKNYIQNFFDSKPSHFYASGIHDIPSRWRQVIDTDGAYVRKKKLITLNKNKNKNDFKI